METATLLHGFAYGEQIEAGRSLGYRLLAPAEPGPWSAELETLARRLQASPYPDDWPIADLFCSALLADGWRVVAVVRYGLVDHTPSRRRGGIEMVGVIAPGRLGVPSALALCRWLKQRRGETDELRSFGGYFDLAEALTQMPPQALAVDAPVLPATDAPPENVRLFRIATPTDPEQHFALLADDHAGNWQWLALVGSDFPLAEYAARGPVIAWKT
jgi:hypothetical protein